MVHNHEGSRVRFETDPHKWRLKKEADRSWLVGGSFNKQGNLRKKLILGCWKMNRSPHPPIRILRVYTEALTGFSHIYHPDGPNNTLFSEGWILEVWKPWVECTFQGLEVGKEAPIAQVRFVLLQHKVIYCMRGVERGDCV